MNHFRPLLNNAALARRLCEPTERSNAMHQDVDLPPAEWPGLEVESASYSDDPVTVGPFANVEEKPRPVGLLLALSLALVGVAAAVVSIKGC